jgi:beta-lactamase superfamily II metal-dependent hydrolase
MRKAAFFILILPLLLSPHANLPSASAQTNPLFKVSFINVGQGDSILLQDGAGFDVLVDGGRPSAGPTVLEYLRETGVADLEVLVATHPDQDHIGGLIGVLEATDIPVEAAIYNGYPGNTDRWFEFTAAVEPSTWNAEPGIERGFDRAAGGFR